MTRTCIETRLRLFNLQRWDACAEGRAVYTCYPTENILYDFIVIFRRAGMYAQSLTQGRKDEENNRLLPIDDVLEQSEASNAYRTYVKGV